MLINKVDCLQPDRIWKKDDCMQILAYRHDFIHTSYRVYVGHDCLCLSWNLSMSYQWWSLNDHPYWNWFFFSTPRYSFALRQRIDAKQNKRWSKLCDFRRSKRWVRKHGAYVLSWIHIPDCVWAVSLMQVSGGNVEVRSLSIACMPVSQPKLSKLLAKQYAIERHGRVDADIRPCVSLFDASLRGRKSKQKG